MNNQPEPRDHEPRIYEADVRRILERAVQIDSTRGTEVTLADLQRVANEVGISSRALMQAFEEIRLARQSSPLPQPPAERPQTQWLSRVRRLLRPAWLASTALLLGLLSATAGEDLALGTFLMTSAASTALAILHRSWRRDAVEAEAAGMATPDQLLAARSQAWMYLLDLVAIWLPWSVLNGLAEAELFAIGSVAWSVAAVVGAAIVLVANPQPGLPNARSRPAPPGPEAAVSR